MTFMSKKASEIAPFVSLIVTAYQQPSILRLLLLSLAHQEFGDCWEVIVCDDGSDNQVLSCVRSFAEQSIVNLRYVWHPDNGYRLSRSRNNGIRLSSGEILIFLDGDMIVKPDFIRSHVEAHLSGRSRGRFRKHRPRLICGSRGWVFTSEHGFNDRLRENLDVFLAECECRVRYSESVSQQRMIQSTTPWMACAGCNFSVQRSQHIWFDEKFVGWGPEDREFAFRLSQKHGYEIRFEPATQAFHIEENLMEQFSPMRPTSHQEITLYLKNLLYFKALYPDSDLDPILTGLRYYRLDPATDQWCLASNGPDVSASPAELWAVAKGWLQRSGLASSD
jgi:glycosyltransferase involved in cell wall biosynthesis